MISVKYEKSETQQFDPSTSLFLELNPKGEADVPQQGSGVLLGSSDTLLNHFLKTVYFLYLLLKLAYSIILALSELTTLNYHLAGVLY